ncbi:MAG: glycosyltransferase family 39 protein [Bacteroidota bacterium]
MFHSYFSTFHQVLLGISVVLLVASGCLFFLKRYKLALMLLILAAIPLKYFIISVDGFVNAWDESFHALVAKNMANFPLKPMLYKNPLIGYDFTSWTANHIWLHKQPLFLWQSAICIKIFGANEIAYRLPTFVLSILFIPVLYRMGVLLVSKATGYIAALFFVLSFFVNNLTSGRYPLAENDVIFMIYIGASCWAYLEYLHSQKKHWLIWIGVFAGFAVLTKWVVGLLVYSTWGANLLLDYRKSKSDFFKSFIPLLKSLGISLLLFIPWTLYTFIRFPQEAKYEFALNARHFTQVIESHAGNWKFHFDMMNQIYAPFNYYIILPILFIGIFLILKRSGRISISLWIVLPLLFYSLAKTKMQSFTIIIFPFVVLMMGAVFEMLYLKIKEKMGYGISLMLAIYAFLLLGYNVFNVDQMQFEHSTQYLGNLPRFERIHNKQEYPKLQAAMQAPIENTALFNVPFPYNIDMMFYTDINAYNIIPSSEQIWNLNKRGYVLYVLNKSLPDSILNNNNIIKISSGLQSDHSW